MSARQVQLRRGSADEHTSFTGADGEVTVDTTTYGLRVHDGQTAGGIKIARIADVIPDYATGINLTAPTTTECTYTAPDDGFFYISFFGCNNIYAYVMVNGSYVVNVTSPSTSIYWPVNQYIPVRAGDVITYKHSQPTATAGVTARFFPTRK